MFAKIALLCQPYTSLTYALPDGFPREFWQPGLRLAIPLGSRSSLCAGVLLRCSERSDLPDGVSCKTACWPLETSPVISNDLLAMTSDLALRQAIEHGHVLGHILPPGLRTARVKLHRLAEGYAENLGLAEIRAASDREKLVFAEELVNGKARLLPPKKDSASEEICHLAIDPPWPVRPAAIRQTEVLEYLLEHGPCSRRRLLGELGRSVAQAIQSLIQAGHVTLKRSDADVTRVLELLPPAPRKFALNDEQQAVLADLLAAMAEQKATSRLLFGVTGSGKTAIYMDLAKACLENGKSVLLLAPEVALAHKLHRDATTTIADHAVTLYHGYQSQSAREACWRKLAEETKPGLVIGTRSALFLPLQQIGCIILDEEHDSSFKQDESISYHTKELAWFRAMRSGAVLLLGSATPDIKTFHAAEQGKLPVLRMTHRIAARQLPPVELIDIGRISGRPNTAETEAILGQSCEKALLETLERGEQAIVMLNRRGYAPLLFCQTCSRTMHCPNCEIGLTYHKGREKLVCHYCGYSRPFPSPCPECGGMQFLPIGEGTEKLAEYLQVLAGKPILRLDRDSTRRPGVMEQILGSFAEQESPILVGTQMLSKGHHFPNVTLAIVADADIGLNLPDYRAAERTFQLLVQSAGRAGRGERPGRVLIQTRDTRHYCWKFVQNADYEGFYAEEIARRKKYRYPPFVRLALIRISHSIQENRAAAAMAELAAALRQKARSLGVQLLGPAPAPIAILRGRRRFHCLAKADNWQELRELYFFAKSQKCTQTILRLFLDLDPVNML